MGKRKVTILEPAIEEVSRIALFIEGKGLAKIARKFIDEAFAFFESLADERLTHRPCKQPALKSLNLRCTSFRRKYIVAYLDHANEIIICEFLLQKLMN